MLFTALRSLPLPLPPPSASPLAAAGSPPQAAGKAATTAAHITCRQAPCLPAQKRRQEAAAWRACHRRLQQQRRRRGLLKPGLQGLASCWQGRHAARQQAPALAAPACLRWRCRLLRREQQQRWRRKQAWPISACSPRGPPPAGVNNCLIELRLRLCSWLGPLRRKPPATHPLPSFFLSPSPLACYSFPL